MSQVLRRCYARAGASSAYGFSTIASREPELVEIIITIFFQIGEAEKL